MRGDYYIEEKEFTKALKVYKFLMTYWRVADNYEYIMIMAEQLGHMHGFVKHHHEACNSFRMMLKYSWILQDAYMEIKAYHHLSQEHFKLGNMEKAKYYLARASGGLLEPDDSRMKSSILQSYKGKIGDPKKYKNKISKINVNNLKKTNEPEALPSPSNDRHQSGKNKAMVLFDGVTKKSKISHFHTL